MTIVIQLGLFALVIHAYWERLAERRYIVHCLFWALNAKFLHYEGQFSRRAVSQSPAKTRRHYETILTVKTIQLFEASDIGAFFKESGNLLVQPIQRL